MSLRKKLLTRGFKGNIREGLFDISEAQGLQVRKKKARKRAAKISKGTVNVIQGKRKRKSLTREFIGF